jgi:YHS domain-containing protein
MLILISFFLVFSMFVIIGCKKKSEPAIQEETFIKAVESDIQKAKEVTASMSEQTLCPIMDAPINKELYTEYQGKKVYFCCPGCNEKFEQNPEQYIAKLPQFKK